MSDNPETTKGQPAFGEAALFGLCPRCGSRTLFAGPISFAKHCNGCSLEFAKFNVGDGPAAFLTFLIGGLVTALAIWLELGFSPPWWLHVVLWLPLTILGVVAGLRFGKAALLFREYSARAEEHRHDGSDLT